MLGIIFLGIVASIAIPNLVAARERSRDAAAQAELRSVMVVEEAYAVEHGTYTTSLADLGGFFDDEQVTTTILSADEFDYEVCSRHEESPDGWRVRSSNAELVERVPGGC